VLLSALLIAVIGVAALLSGANTNRDLVLVWSNGQPVTERTCDEIKLQPKTDLVILGETTHGSENIRALNACLVKHLIVQQGFTQVLLEWDFADVVQLNYYIQGDWRFTKDAVLKPFKRTLYDSKAFVELFDWLRDQNRRGKAVSIYGIDNWNTQRLFEFAVGYGKKTALERCIGDNAQSFSSIYSQCSALFEALEYKPGDFRSQNHYLLLFGRALEQVYGNRTFDDQQAARDRFMYRLFTEIVGQAPQQKRVALMHAGHALPYPQKFGSYLVDQSVRFEQYLLTFCRGAVVSTKEVKRSFVTLEFDRPPPDTIESVLCQRNAPDSRTRYAIRNVPGNVLSSDPAQTTSTPPTLEIAGVFLVPESRPLAFAVP
jgi:erythromycin esterase-like protein